ncbi:unnamed protein product [Mytilus coruscus]|uniref:CCHC-type domain-containing protein n=1 Tax=Mytilus coruscus TaxID=42192 RepID=A0A6J8B5E2_MYTCO|nr:unnamed protein product [Mytilus coruscus]
MISFFTDVSNEHAKHVNEQKCTYCGSCSHKLEDCKGILSLNIQNRYEHFKSKGHCFGCSRIGHRTVNCRMRASCLICNKRHPTLHHDKEKVSRDINPMKQTECSTKVEYKTSAYTSYFSDNNSQIRTGDMSCGMAIIPVRVKLKNKAPCVETYAFFDSGISVSFCTENLLHKLGGNGKRMQITLNTMVEPYKKTTYAVSGLQVLDQEMNDRVELLRIYTKDEMPVSIDHIPKEGLQQLRGRKNKFIKNPRSKQDYTDFIDYLLERGYMEHVRKEQFDRNDGRVWYIPHNGVYHSQKPDKISIVFDCSTTYKGVSLNKQLLQGPDHTYNHLGVLIRFREEKVAILGDIEDLFQQDASEICFGMVFYLCLVDYEEGIRCSFVLGKSRIAPLIKVTIPRMELTAATRRAVKFSKVILDELNYNIGETFFWTDSMSVVRYISNQNIRFHTFEATNVEQWKYINTKLNPADYASRGMSISKFESNPDCFNGPLINKRHSEQF